MTPWEAVQMVGKWPADRTIPRRLSQAAKDAKGEERAQILSLVEALMAAADSAADIDLVNKYFG